MHYKKNTTKKLAFSLLELSIVLIIISALMVAVIKGSDLIDQARISSAAQKTADSPVLKINGLVAWFEPTLPNSFLDSEMSDGGGISTWNDSSGNNPLHKLSLTQATSTSRPLYSKNAINTFPTLKFDGVDDFLGTTIRFPYNSYQIFVVFRLLNNSTSLDIMSTDTSGLNGLILETQTTGIIRTLHRFPYGSTSSNSDSFLSPSGALSIDQNYVLSYSRNSISTASTLRLNGTTTMTSVTTRPGFDATNVNLSVGSLMGVSRYFNGYIAEIIIYNRVLSDQERDDIEQYLSDKYQITIS